MKASAVFFCFIVNWLLFKYMWLYMKVNLSICLCPGRFTVQLMGQQPSRGGAAGEGWRSWSSWRAVRRPGAPGHPGTERRPTLLSVEHLLGWAVLLLNTKIHQSRGVTLYYWKQHDKLCLMVFHFLKKFTEMSEITWSTHSSKFLAFPNV